MNDHEIERIAAAMHELRPDWPTASLRTLITKQLSHKPRRDVCVALAWVACESASATPARVLNEHGPWWRAAAIDESGPAKTYDRNATCATCGQAKDRCRQLWEGDHEYVTVAEHQATATTTAEHIAELRALKAGRHVDDAEPTEANKETR